MRNIIIVTAAAWKRTADSSNMAADLAGADETPR
jgi:hypothetical protein